MQRLYFQALINEKGPAGKCVSAALAGNVTLFVSRFILDEIRRTATDSILRTESCHITDERLDLLIANLEKVARVVGHVKERIRRPERAISDGLIPARRSTSALSCHHQTL